VDAPRSIAADVGIIIIIIEEDEGVIEEVVGAADGPMEFDREAAMRIQIRYYKYIILVMVSNAI
jgi:hypothetical protein